jgi:hypothetical protein
MENMTAKAGLKNAIEFLEAEQAVRERLLREQFILTYESLKPVNLIRNTLDDLASSPNLIDNIVGTASGLATGYLSKKLFIGTSGNKFRKLLGAILQFSIISVVTRHPDAIKSIGHLLTQHILRKKGLNTEEL